MTVFFFFFFFFQDFTGTLGLVLFGSKVCRLKTRSTDLQALFFFVVLFIEEEEERRKQKIEKYGAQGDRSELQFR